MLAKKCKFCAITESTNCTLNEEILGRNLAKVIENICGFEVKKLSVKNVLVCQMCAMMLISTDNINQRVRAMMSKFRKKASPSSLNRSSVVASSKKTPLKEELSDSDETGLENVDFDASEMGNISNVSLTAASKPKKTWAKKVNPDQKKNTKPMQTNKLESKKSDLNEVNTENSYKAAVENIITPAKEVNLADKKESPKPTEIVKELEESKFYNDNKENSNILLHISLTENIKLEDDIETLKTPQIDETESNNPDLNDSKTAIEDVPKKFPNLTIDKETEESDSDNDDIENSNNATLKKTLADKIKLPGYKETSKSTHSDEDSEESDLDDMKNFGKAPFEIISPPKMTLAKKIKLPDGKKTAKLTQHEENESEAHESDLDDDLENFSKAAFVAKKFNLQNEKKITKPTLHETASDMDESDLDDDDLEKFSKAAFDVVASQKTTLTKKFNLQNEKKITKPTLHETASDMDESDLDDDDLENFSKAAFDVVASQKTTLTKKFNLQNEKKITKPTLQESDLDESDLDDDDLENFGKAAFEIVAPLKMTMAKKIKLPGQKGILNPTQNECTDSGESVLDEDFMQNLSKTDFEVLTPPKLISAKKFNLPDQTQKYTRIGEAASKNDKGADSSGSSEVNLQSKNFKMTRETPTKVKEKPKKRQRSMNNSDADIPKKKNKISTPKTKALKTKTRTPVTDAINKESQEIKIKKYTKKDKARDADKSFRETLNISPKMLQTPHSIPNEKVRSDIDDDQTPAEEEVVVERQEHDPKTTKQKLRNRNSTKSQSVIELRDPMMKYNQDLEHKSCPNCSRTFRSLEKYEKHLSSAKKCVRSILTHNYSQT